MKKKTVLIDVISYFFIILFVYTGIAKFMEMQVFHEQMLSSPLLGGLAGFIVWALPIVEILLAVALLIPALKLKALYATLGLMTLFTIYVIAILFIDNQVSCSCGGIIEELSPTQHLIFNSSCVFLSLVAIIVYRKNQPSVRFAWLAGSSTVCVFLALGWILFTAFSAPTTIKTGMEGRPLPAFELLLLDSTTRLNTADIPTGKPLIMIGFSPTCTHCGAETDDIIKHIGQFKDMQICFVTPYPVKQMKGFYRYFKIQDYPNIIMGSDVKNVFLSYFKAKGVPYTAIFDSKKRLKQVFQSQTKTTKIIEAVAE
jgi:hypothetical protein